MTTAPAQQAADPHAALERTFGYTTFRPLQEEVVSAVLAGRDTFVLLPTGGGKSLCYQLPALLSEGVTVVVSPLIALMQDQVDQLDALGVPATFINSTLTPGEASRRMDATRRGLYKLVYVAPERLVTSGFLTLLDNSRVARFAIDEAHCISEWGHDFRPEYRTLSQLRQRYPDVPMIALTATATRRVQADILRQLALREPATFRGSFNRANLFYEVQPKRDASKQLREFLRARRDQSGIIYCFSRRRTEELAERLRADGFKATAYHAGLEGDERERRQRAFIRDDVQIMVATIAFGMGIDKPDVRFVIHYDLPKSLEGYYQESGRAGRDGEPAHCLLFFGRGDLAQHARFIDEKPPAEREAAKRQLAQMAAWAGNAVCRRQALLAYFDEALDAAPGRCCDVCDGGGAAIEQRDYTAEARKLLGTVRRSGERFGAAHIVEVLRGTASEKVLKFGHDRLPAYGWGAAISARAWRHIVDELAREGYLLVDADHYNALKLTDRGYAVLKEGIEVLLAAPPSSLKRERAAPAFADLAERDVELFESLRGLRKKIADERAVPPYVVFSDRSLRQMAADRPTSLAAFKQVNGVGEHKAAEFGPAFLLAIRAHETAAEPVSSAQAPSTAGGAESHRDEKRATARRSSGSGGQSVGAAYTRLLAAVFPEDATRRIADWEAKDTGQARPAVDAEGEALSAALGATAARTLQLHRRGLGLQAIADQRALAPSTIVGHLVRAHAAGEVIDLDLLVPTDKQSVIRAALAEAVDNRIVPVLEQLGDGYTYDEIRLVRDMGGASSAN